MNEKIGTDGMPVVTVKLIPTGCIGAGETIQTPSDAVRVMGEVITDSDRELVCVINLKSDGKPINCNLVSMGGINQSIAEPAMILKSAMLSNAASIILLHNHPSGDASPSMDDRAVTERMEKVCKLVGIRFLDHVIIGRESCYSFSTKETIKLTDYMRNASEPAAQSQEVTLLEVLEKYFLTPEKEGFSYQDRLQEGLDMLDMIASDLDKIESKNFKIKDYIMEKAKQEGIIKETERKVYPSMIRKGR